jgi:hypothetical protein
MTKYDLSQAFELGKPRKKIIYCDRDTVNNHCNDYNGGIIRLISKSFDSNKFYHRISFNRYDKKWNYNGHGFNLDAFEITVCSLKPKPYSSDVRRNIIYPLIHEDIDDSLSTLNPDVLSIVDAQCETIYAYKLEKLYESQKSGLFVIMNKPVEFNKQCSSEPAITQYASIDIYNAFIRKSIEQALNDCGLTDKNEPSYSTNEVTVNSESGSIHIVRRLHDEFVARLQQRVFDVILAEVCEYNDGAIRKFLRSNKIEPYKFADQLFSKFAMKDRRFCFDLKIGKEESDDTVQHTDTI